MKSSPAKPSWVNNTPPDTAACWTCYLLLQRAPKVSKLKCKLAAQRNVSRVTRLPAFLPLQTAALLIWKAEVLLYWSRSHGPSWGSISSACLPALLKRSGGEDADLREGMRTLRRDLAYAGNLLMVVKRSRLVAGA